MAIFGRIHFTPNLLMSILLSNFFISTQPFKLYSEVVSYFKNYETFSFLGGEKLKDIFLLFYVFYADKKDQPQDNTQEQS